MKIDDFLASPQTNNPRAGTGRIDDFLGAPSAQINPPTSSLGAGISSRALGIVGDLIEGAARIGEQGGDYLERKIPLSGLTESQIQERQLDPLFKATEWLKRQQQAINYQPSVDFQQVKADPLNLPQTGKFIIEQGVSSIPDMAASMVNLPGYILSRTNNVADERVKNEGRPGDVNLADMAKAAPGAIAEATLERFATGRLLPGKITGASAPARIGKQVGIQAGTEGIEEVAGYAGETVGTKAGFNTADATDRFLAGALVGGPMGGSVQSGAEVISRIMGSQAQPVSEPVVPQQTQAPIQSADVNQQPVNPIAELGSLIADTAMPQSKLDPAPTIDQFLGEPAAQPQAIESLGVAADMQDAFLNTPDPAMQTAPLDQTLSKAVELPNSPLAQTDISEQPNAPAFIDLDKHSQVSTPTQGMRIGDIARKDGSAFKTIQAARAVAKKAGAGWVTSPSNEGYVVRYRPHADKQVSATAKRIAKQRKVTAKDSMLQAVSKLGGINSDELTKVWGVSLADLGNKGAGILRVAKKDGMSADRMADSLKELGFITEDPITGKHDLTKMMELFMEEARGGAKTYANNEGGAIEDQYNQYQQDGYDEWIAAKDAEDAALNKLSEEAQTLIGQWVGEDYERSQNEDAELRQELAQWEQSGETQDRTPEFNNESIDFANENPIRRGARLAQDDGRIDSQPAGEDRGDQGADEATPSTGEKQSPIRQAGTGSPGETKEAFSLESQTEVTLKAAEEAKAAAEKAKQEADRAADARAKADAEVGQFNLTGSDGTADVAAAQGQQQLGGGDAVFSASGKSLPESQWLSESEITQIIDDLIGKFAHQPPIFIRDSVADVIPGFNAYNRVQGVSMRGKIYLFRDGIGGSRTELIKTLWHELLHYGVRRFMNLDQYIAETKKLYESDAWIKAQADGWLNSKYGKEIEARHGKPYALARGVDEALADFAEENQGVLEPTIKARVIRTIARWIALLADRLGFKDMAAKWRGYSNEEASSLIREIYGNLRSGAEPTNPNSGFTTDPTFRAEDGDSQSNLDLNNPNPKPEPFNKKDLFTVEKMTNGQRQYVAGAKAYKVIADFATEHLGKIGLADNRPEAFKQMMRQFKVDQLKYAQTAKAVAEKGKGLIPEQRAMISDLIEKGSVVGDAPPQEIVDLAAKISAALDTQGKELVELGMLSKDSLIENYLPRLYKNHLAAKLTNRPKFREWFGRARVKVRGDRIKARGLFEVMPIAQVEHAKKLGWEVSSSVDGSPLQKDLTDAIDNSEVIPSKYKDTKVLMWRDYTEAERAKMGEIRDGVLRYAMGYVETQKDIAIGKLFKVIAANTDLAKTFDPGGWVKIPDTEVPGTFGLKAYGSLAGMYVEPQVANSLKRNTQPKGTLMAAYDKGLSLWKEGKTVWNPISHGNNVVSNLFMLHFSGVNPADPRRYRETLREFKTGGKYWTEAVDGGLFGNEMANAEIQKLLMPDLEQMINLESVATSKTYKLIDALTTTGSWKDPLKIPANIVVKYREKMQKAYEFEDQFAKLMIYIDRRKSGMSEQEAVTDAERYIFNYSDMPEGVELLKRTYAPFLSYTYRIIPALLHTGLTRPDRLLAPAALLYGANWLAYAIAGSDEEEDRKAMPEYMQGRTSIGTLKNIRLPFDIGGNPAFLDMSRRVPGGDLFDFQNQAGGVSMPAPLMPSNPLMSIVGAMIFNTDTFTGKDITKKSDTSWEAAKARGNYLYKQLMPNAPIIPGSYNFDKAADGLASATGFEFGPYNGVTRSGDAVSPAAAAAGVTGLATVRSFDVDKSMEFKQSAITKEAREIKANIRSAARNQSITAANREEFIQSQLEKLERLKEKGDKLQ